MVTVPTMRGVRRWVGLGLILLLTTTTTSLAGVALVTRSLPWTLVAPLCEFNLTLFAVFLGLGVVSARSCTRTRTSGARSTRDSDLDR